MNQDELEASLRRTARRIGQHILHYSTPNIPAGPNRIHHTTMGSIESLMQTAIQASVREFVEQNLPYTFDPYSTDILVHHSRLAQAIERGAANSRFSE